jgi:hypothetical protein
VGWSDGSETSYSGAWLRDHDFSAIHSTTKQRQSDSLGMLRDDGGLACTPYAAWVGGDEDDAGAACKVWVRWGAAMDLHDGSTQAPAVTGFPTQWLEEHADAKTDAETETETDAEPELWGGSFGAAPTDEEIRARALHAGEFMADDAVLAEALRQLRVTGFCLVDGVERTQAGTTAHIERIGQMRRTVYSDGIWYDGGRSRLPPSAGSPARLHGPRLIATCRPRYLTRCLHRQGHGGA